ncbi:sensor histidine kinase [Streptomyces violens]|uniref:sensor histidine kinase n=1 Tax=Streptomyces violens TaxID=66377 RepID=UPI00068D407B|nr:ATP-binding protein [Streptomyces violens]
MTTNKHRPPHRAPRAWHRLLTVRARLTLVATVAITALLGFVLVDAWGDWQQQTQLRNDSATGELGGEASLPLFVGAQQERRLTAAYLARRTAAAKARLDKQRAATDKGVSSFRHLSGTKLETERRHKWAYVERVYEKIDGLQATRRAVDARTGDPDEATGYYTELLSTMVQFYQALSAMDDAQLTQETRPLVGLFWASEGASQEDALLGQAQAAGGMSAEHRRAFAEAYGSQRVMYRRWIAPYLPEEDKRTYDRIVSSRSWRTVEQIEGDLISAPTTNGAIETLPSSVQQWDRAYGEVAQQVAGLNLNRTQGLLAHGYERADAIRSAVFIKLGISLAIVVALALLIFGVTRTVIRRADQVRVGALTVAQDLLPTIVRDLQHGRAADRSTLPQAHPHPRDEFDQVGNALALLAQQAADAAETVYDERRGFAAFAEGVSTRAVVIIGRRLLTLLDQLQSDYGDDPQLLGRLYELDHQLVRVRRLLENLQVLSGGQLDHPHDRPVHVANLLMDAAGESAGFKRVIKDFRAEAWVSPEAAGELTHLLAELIDNATTFSPEQYQITIRSVEASAGVAIEVEDRGQPLHAGQISELNTRLEQTPLYGDLARTSHQLGLFVVGQLAQRLGVKVTLSQSRYLGALATVLVPYALLTQAPEPLVQNPSGPSRQEPREGHEQNATTASGLVKRMSQRRADQQHSLSAAGEARHAAGPGPQPVPGLPQRKPGTHLVKQLQHEAPVPAARRQAVDPRPLEEIENAFSALDDIKITPHGEDL